MHASAALPDRAAPGAVRHDRLVPVAGRHGHLVPVAGRHDRLVPGASSASAVAALLIHECDLDTPRVLLPHTEIHLVARFGPWARGGLDVHAFGVRQQVHRKLLHGGQRSVMARLRLGVPEAVLGVPAAALADRVATLDELWGDGATRRLLDRLADARDSVEAAAILERALAARLVPAAGRQAHTHLALAAADRLTGASVNAVAADLGVSERHLRRVFLETVGVSPKTFARLTRFHRALGAARQGGPARWASIASDAGYYDQAHLIAEFRAIAGVTPRALLGELRAAPALD
ncbi:MAG: AraC family transcriptional regulator [Myxococcales bacterium]|nr:MAG: AraC family transcriptional regulator [Myxococcales bacterium]